MITRLEAVLCYAPYVTGDNNDLFYGVYLFRECGSPIKSIKNITFNGLNIDDVCEYIKIDVFLGNQTLTSDMLYKNIPEWPNDRIMKGVPYLAVKAEFNDIFDGVNISADVEF